MSYKKKVLGDIESHPTAVFSKNDQTLHDKSSVELRVKGEVLLLYFSQMILHLVGSALTLFW